LAGWSSILIVKLLLLLVELGQIVDLLALLRD